MGEVPEEPEAPRDRGKRRFLNFSLGEINWLNIGKGVGVVLLASLGAGYGNHVLGDKVYVADPAMAAEIEKLKGKVEMAQAITDIVKEQVKGIAEKTDATQQDVGDLKTSTKVMELKMENLNEKADKLDKNQSKLQDGIDEILKSLNKKGVGH